MFDIDKTLQLLAVRKPISLGREIFNMVMKAWDARENVELEAYYEANRGGLKHQYFDYLDIEQTNIVIDGGMYDGRETVKFCQRVGIGGQVYSIDPWGKKFAGDTLRVRIDNHNIVEAGL